MSRGHALSDHEQLARHYADLAVRGNETGATLGEGSLESPEWKVHYDWAMHVTPQDVRAEIARRTDMLVKGLGGP